MSAPSSRGTLQVGGHEGVVHDQQGAVAVRQLRNCGNVGDLQGRVRGGLKENDLHVRGEVLIAQGREVADEAGLHSAFSQLGGREAVGAAVGGMPSSRVSPASRTPRAAAVAAIPEGYA